jgi:hypothetical protein
MKSQSAMEYLMTYGWSILVIAVVLGTLYSLNVFSSANYAPKAPPGSCKVFKSTMGASLQGVCTNLQPQFVASFSGLNSYVNIVPQSTLPTSALTVTAWIYSTGGSGYHAIVSAMTGPYTGAFDLSTNINNWQVGNGILTSRVSSGSIQNGQWYFLAGVYTANNNIVAYLNGVPGTPASILGSISYANSYCGQIRIGQRCDSSANFYNGIISNVQIYNISLDQSQIQALYNEGFGGAPINPQGLVGWWPLNGDSKDYSGNNNHGTATNVVFTTLYN